MFLVLAGYLTFKLALQTLKSLSRQQIRKYHKKHCRTSSLLTIKLLPCYYNLPYIYSRWFSLRTRMPSPIFSAKSLIYGEEKIRRGSLMTRTRKTWSPRVNPRNRNPILLAGNARPVFPAIFLT